MSEIPYNLEATQLNWTAFENESLMILNNEGDYFFMSGFVNHSPQFELASLTDTLWVLDNYSILLTATDIDEDSLFYSIANNPAWMNIENQSLNIYPEELGVYNFQVIVSDGELEDVLNVSFNIVGGIFVSFSLNLSIAALVTTNTNIEDDYLFLSQLPIDNHNNIIIIRNTCN